MSAELRSELVKLRSTRTTLGLFAAMVGLTLFAVALHGVGVAEAELDSSSAQLTEVFGRGELIGILFAGLLGAMSITAEVRYGTIRPTFLVTPRRGRVIAAKVQASMLTGATFGAVACGLAAGVGAAALGLRGIDAQLKADDYLLFIAGGGVAAAIWAAIGVGVAGLVRSQVPTLVGICAWLLFVESILLTGLADVGRFAPGPAAAALTGQDPEKLIAPAAGLLVLALYGLAAVAAGLISMTRRDVV
jgi:ABC-type transport system involved in multi-copper enzyme maturation permease subunit